MITIAVIISAIIKVRMAFIDFFRVFLTYNSKLLFHLTEEVRSYLIRLWVTNAVEWSRKYELFVYRVESLTGVNKKRAKLSISGSVYLLPFLQIISNKYF